MDVTMRIEGIGGMDDRTKVICKSRNRYAGKSLKAIREMVNGKCGIGTRIARGIETVWAFVWAVTFGGVWIEMGERLGLWERIEDDEDQH